LPIEAVLELAVRHVQVINRLIEYCASSAIID
jgi:hypothetical protein